MVGLLNIGKLNRTVRVREAEVNVTGITAMMFLSLLDRFKDLQGAMSGEKLNLSPADILKLAPEIVAAIIAAGIGHPNDRAQEEAALDLRPGEQVDVLNAIMDVSIGGELGPFVEKLKRLGLDRLFDQKTGTAQDIKSPQQLNGSYGLASTRPQMSGDTQSENSTAGSI